MNLPNKLTFLRLILTPFAVIFLFIDIPYNYYIAIIIFIIAVLTDFFDGYIARKFNIVSKIGIFFDPLMDKILNYSMLITLLSLGVFPLWIVLLLFARDIFIDAFRNLAVSNKVYVKANYPGKFKAVFLFIAIIIGELSLAAKSGYDIFSLSYEFLRNSAYTLLIISLFVGFIGSGETLGKVWNKMTGKFKF